MYIRSTNPPPMIYLEGFYMGIHIIYIYITIYICICMYIYIYKISSGILPISSDDGVLFPDCPQSSKVLEAGLRWRKHGFLTMGFQHSAGITFPFFLWVFHCSCRDYILKTLGYVGICWAPTTGQDVTNRCGVASASPLDATTTTQNGVIPWDLICFDQERTGT